MVIMTARLLQIIVGLAGLCALVLGLLIWIANSDLTDIHMLFGLLVTLGLLVMSIIALTAPGLRLWGMVGIVYALIVLIFGVSHSTLLVGNLRLYDPDAAHAGRYRRSSADERTRRALQDAQARRGEARSFISSAAALSFSFSERPSRATRGPILIQVPAFVKGGKICLFPKRATWSR
jgi:hypothetical protein